MIDAHVHVWTDDKSRYPRATGERDYEPARFTPEDLFRHRPRVSRVMSIEEMDEAIAAAVSRSDD